ncbi:MAG TPA: TonB-dependent receptor [Polyangiaceae bacterium]|nr:TonB-dependent receptor [Polyangiaceae bacterium]
MFARTICAHGAGVACALWVSSGWAQQTTPPPEPPAEQAPAAPEAAPEPAPAPADTAPADAPAGDAAASAEGEVGVDLPPGVEPLPEDVEDPTPSGGMDEVIVTVDRRKKDLQDYSGTASAFNESQLRNIGVTNITQMSQMVPGVQIGQNDQGSSTIFIRGVGSDNTTELGDPAVAVHVDNVYLPRFRGMSAAWLDVQRVEVNSGPQGTVRGRNATGGSVNIISKPAVLGEFQGMAEMTYGTYRQRQYQGMLNIPIGDHVAIRMAGMSNSMDPTWENLGPIGHLPGAQDANDYSGKAQIRWAPSSKLDIVVAGDYTLQRSLGWTGANVINLLNRRVDVNGTPNDLSDDVLSPIDPNSIDNPRYNYQRGRYPEAETTHWGTRLNVNYDAGPVQVEFLASYRYLDWHQYSGSNAGFFVDETAAQIPQQQYDNWSYAQQQNNDSKSAIGELRFASPDDQQLVWSLGAFGYWEDQGAFLGQVQADPGGFNEFNMPSTVGWSVAGYGDATFKVTDSFRLLAGLRYSKEHKDRLGGIWMIGSNLPTGSSQLCARQNAAGDCVEFGLANDGIGRFGTEGFNFKGLSRNNYNVPAPGSSQEERVNFFLDGIESFGVRDQVAIALCNDPEVTLQQPLDPTQAPTRVNSGRLTRDANGNFRCANGIRESFLTLSQGENPFLNVQPQNGEREDGYFDFRAGVEYDLASDNLLYATVSSGHKAGGFNDSLPDPDRPGEYITPDYGIETVYAAEIGSKNLLADRRLRLNASAFAFLYDGLQFQTIITVGSPPPLQPNGQVQIDPNTGMPYPDNRSGSAARQNAEEPATAYGLDLDAVYALPAGLEADFHALFMDARFPDKTYVNDGRLGLGSNNAQVDIGGMWLPRVSPYTFNYSLSQLIPSEIGNFDWIIQGQTRGRHFMTPYNGDGTSLAPRGPDWGIGSRGENQNLDSNAAYQVVAANVQRFDDEVPTYTVFNVGLGWRRLDGLLSVRVFVNNALNTTYATTIGSTSGNNIRFYNDPRMAGVRVRMDF